MSHAETTGNKRSLETHCIIRIYDKRAGKPLAVSSVYDSILLNFLPPPSHMLRLHQMISPPLNQMISLLLSHVLSLALPSLSDDQPPSESDDQPPSISDTQHLSKSRAQDVSESDDQLQITIEKSLTTPRKE